MGSESLDREDIQLYMWHDRLDPDNYVEATYYLETAVSPEITAVAMAKEQSAIISGGVAGIDSAYDLSPYTARVTSVQPIGETEDTMLPFYRLSVPIYNQGIYRKKGYWSARVKIAFPIANFGPSLTNLWSAAGGELHRLGFLNALKMLDLDLPEAFLKQFPGPKYGISGIKSQLQIEDRPIFCRSARPAVGLTTEMMLKINEAVLRGGFDVIKDDELTNDTPLSPFRDRIKMMVNLVRRVEEETGERKYYIANIIASPLRTFELADAAAEAGANAVLVAPPIQGFEIAGEIARRTGLAVLCHNSWADVLSRHPRFGVSYAVFFKMQRICGADMILLPGDFATDYIDPGEAKDFLSACVDSLGSIRPSLPIIAGGKRAKHLRQYLDAFGSTDFMIIAATAVDTHPEGIEAGARAFREAWSQIADK
ncbi:Ribulose bisphosphate carboxylase-like protein [subsurface metagenome]